MNDPRNAWARAARFLREVRAELGKVVWPTPRELVVYTVVVVVVVVAMTAFVLALDQGFARLVLRLFR